nr:hypothetical protein CFP56_11178 [Quercus suber]
MRAKMTERKRKREEGYEAPEEGGLATAFGAEPYGPYRITSSILTSTCPSRRRPLTHEDSPAVTSTAEYPISARSSASQQYIALQRATAPGKKPQPSPDAEMKQENEKAQIEQGKVWSKATAAGMEPFAGARDGLLQAKQPQQPVLQREEDVEDLVGDEGEDDEHGRDQRVQPVVIRRRDDGGQDHGRISQAEQHVKGLPEEVLADLVLLEMPTE